MRNFPIPCYTCAAMWKKLRRRFTKFLLAVRAIEVGKPGDGVDEPFFSSGTEIDKPWAELYDEIQQTREAGRNNPYAKRLIGLTTAYVVGTDMIPSTQREDLVGFIDEFWSHEMNNLSLRLEDWSDELARSGELFITLHPNPVSGMPIVRTIPSSRIRQVKCKDGDYETETMYREIPYVFSEEVSTQPDYMQDKWWYSPAGIELARQEGKKIDRDEPWMLHYAVNREIGAVRGSGDLVSILIWLRRYNRWLEDRVKLNAAIRKFYWIVKAPEEIRDILEERYAVPPDDGTIIFADEDEDWQPVNPTLNARDASADGRAIRWKIAAGGPGTSLTDLGESEDSNLATARASAEQRRRFLLRRQSYFAWMVQDIVAKAYNRQLDHQMYPQMQEMMAENDGKYVIGMNGAAATDKKARTTDIHITRPDIAVEDNFNTAQALMSLGESMINVRNIVGDSEELRGFLFRIFMRYAEEVLSEEEILKIINGTPVEQQDPTQPTQAVSNPGMNHKKPSATTRSKNGTRPKTAVPA